LSAYSPALWILEKEFYLSSIFIVTNYLLLSALKHLCSTLCSLYVTIAAPSQICAVDYVLSFEANYELLRTV